MAKIDFAFGAPDRLRTACAMVRSRFQAGHTLTVWCSDALRLDSFDRMLWAFDDISFIPHVYADDPLVADTPIILTRQADTWPDTLWLVNLDMDCPPEPGRYERVLEIVSQEEDEVLAARERWKWYKQAGHELVAHNLGQKR